MSQTSNKFRKHNLTLLQTTYGIGADTGSASSVVDELYAAASFTYCGRPSSRSASSSV
jgi:hypothetical protein